MATSDLLAALQNPDWKQASYSDDSSQVCEKVVKQLDDSSGDISALAVKWYDMRFSSICFGLGMCCPASSSS